MELYNFPASEEKFSVLGSLEGTEYRGRILISASLERCPTPYHGISSSLACQEPETFEARIWLDVYEITCSLTTSSEIRVSLKLRSLEKSTSDGIYPDSEEGKVFSNEG